uniref:5MP1/2-like HEAT domain-containing protein n=1 Tax=Knipowitschia caucasica TaxID=637954 RepID=A0AAV2LD25_KNICA
MIETQRSNDSKDILIDFKRTRRREERPRSLPVWDSTISHQSSRDSFERLATAGTSQQRGGERFETHRSNDSKDIMTDFKRLVKEDRPRSLPVWDSTMSHHSRDSLERLETDGTSPTERLGKSRWTVRAGRAAEVLGDGPGGGRPPCTCRTGTSRSRGASASSHSTLSAELHRRLSASLRVSFMNNQKQQKPTLTGQRFKTRKRDEKERFDPTQFQESIVQGLNQTGTDLEAVAKFLDASGAKLDYRRYAETLFDILVAGGMLAPGGTLSDDMTRTEFCLFTAQEDLETMQAYAQILRSSGSSEGCLLFDVVVAGEGGVLPGAFPDVTVS